MSSKKRASLSDNSPLDALFGPSAKAEVGKGAPAATPPEPDAQPEAAEPEAPSLRQTTIMIYEEQSTWLDEVCYLAKRDSGSNVSKAAIIRALVDLAREYEVELGGTQSDEEIKRRLKETLGLR